MKETLAKLEPYVYPAIRIIVGLMFVLHGMQKVFGVFGLPEAVPIASQAGVGGVIELTTGLLMALGLFTRPAAFLASGQMAVAFFQFHVFSPKGFQILPIQNGGDDTVLYCFWFFLVFLRGPGKLALDNVVFANRSV